MSSLTRRNFIATGGLVGLGALAGCLGIGSSSGPGTPDPRNCANASSCNAETAAVLFEDYLIDEYSLTTRVTGEGSMDDIGGFASLLVEHLVPSGGRSELYENIATIADAYVVALRDGFEIGGLDGEVVDSLNVEYPAVIASWYIERDWAVAYIEGVLTDEEYRLRALRTFTIG